jgi:hypothetical protein
VIRYARREVLPTCLTASKLRNPGGFEIEVVAGEFRDVDTYSLLLLLRYARKVSTQTTVYLYSSYGTIPIRSYFHIGTFIMANLNTIGTRFGSEYVPSTIVMRIGRRELFFGPDFRRRYSTLSPILDCRAGTEPGYVELVLLRKWLIVLSRAK